MSCYNKDILLSYLDNEIKDDNIKFHITSCKKCQNKILEIEENKNMLYSILEKIDSKNIEIKPFVYKPNNEHKIVNLYKNNIKRFSYSAVIIFLIIISIKMIDINRDRKISGNYFTYYDSDPNKVWNSKELVIVVSNFNIVEEVINTGRKEKKLTKIPSMNRNYFNDDPNKIWNDKSLLLIIEDDEKMTKEEILITCR